MKKPKIVFVKKTEYEVQEKMKVQIRKLVRVSEGTRFLEMGFDPFYYKTNLPYKKTELDWKFYGRAILKIIKFWEGK